MAQFIIHRVRISPALVILVIRVILVILVMELGLGDTNCAGKVFGL